VRAGCVQVVVSIVEHSKKGRQVTQVRSPEAINARIAQQIYDTVGEHRYRMWFDRSARLDYEDDQKRLHITVPNGFVADWIGRKFRDDITAAAAEATGDSVDLAVRVAPDSFPAVAPAAAPRGRAAVPPQRRQTPKRDSAEAGLRHSLDTFIVGPSNELAYATAKQLVDDEQDATSPLFIHGGVGLGKTHLLQGVCRRMLERRPQARVKYTTGEEFTNGYIHAVRHGKIDEWRRGIRRLDLLAIDDVHFLSGKVKTQQEFQHCIDAIEQGGARVVMASDCHPKLIKQFSEALVSRFVRGMVVQVNEPDTNTRIRIVSELARRRKLSLMETVVAVLANRCRGSVRELEGTLAKLHAVAMLVEQSGERQAGDPIGHAVLNRLLHTEQAAPRRRLVTVDDILDTVAEHMQISRQQILGNSRQRFIVLARSLAICLIRQLKDMSYPEIAAALGRSSHSSIITAYNRIVEQIEQSGDEPMLIPTMHEEISLRALLDRLAGALKT